MGEILAHELRNPLAPLRFGLSLLEDTPEPDKQEKLRSLMVRQVDQMVRLVDDLMDMSRVTHGQLELRRDVVDVREVLDEAVEVVRPTLEERNHHLDFERPSDPQPVFADASRLTQVVGNLLNNAVKYSPQPGRISLRCAHEGDRITIEVEDEGVGLAADAQTQIFGMFNQIEPAGFGRAAGLGIGLTMVKAIVEMHGGSVSVESEGANCGSRFTVSLPAHQGVVPESGRGQRTAPGNVDPKRVLVADDNEDTVIMLAKTVEALGHDVRVAGNGRECVEIAKEFQPDFVFLDIGMPIMNGYEAPRAIRSQEWSAATTLVAVTGWGQKSDISRSRKVGFDHHLVKPASAAAVAAILSDGHKGVDGI